MKRLSPSTFYSTILVVVVLLSLTRALTPVTSRAASWRESLTELMVSSIAEGHTSILEAKVSHIHPSNTRFAAEFPTYSSLVAIGHKLLGSALWHGRLVSFLFAILGLWAFYRILVFSFADHQLSILAIVLLAMSNWLIIGSQVMPDVPAAAMVLMAVLFAIRYVAEGKLKWLGFAMSLTLLGGLTKLPALILLAWIVLGLRADSTKRVFILGIALVLAVIPSVIYYFVWLPKLVEGGAMALMYPTEIRAGLNQVFNSHLSNTIDMILYRGWGGYFLSVLGIIGSSIILFARNEYVSRVKLLVLFGGSILGLLMFSAKAGATLATHPYYAIPFLPLLALGGASLLRRIPKQQFIYLACLIALTEIGVRHFAKDKQGRAFAELSQEVGGTLPLGPYISGFNLNPQPSYYFERPTWAWSSDNINDSTLRAAARSEGAKGIILPSQDTSKLEFSYKVLGANNKIAVVNFQ